MTQGYHGDSRPDWALRVRGLLYAAVFVSLWTWLAGVFRRWDGSLGFSVAPILAPGGILLMVAGVVLTATCLGLFLGPGRGTPAPLEPPTVFVARGPYRWVRNPMYWGAFAIILGAGLWLGSPGITLLSAVFLGVAHLFVTLYEEPALERRFGATYHAYRDRVRRWLPRIPA